MSCAFILSKQFLIVKLPRGMFFLHSGKSRTHALDVHILPKPYADWAEKYRKKVKVIRIFARSEKSAFPMPLSLRTGST